MLPTYKQPDGTVLRAGFTTGTCAAAAAKAATLLLFHGVASRTVEVETPLGLKLKLPVAQCEQGEAYARAAVRKDAGDDPDITDGLLIVADVRLSDSNDIRLEGGEGVGRVTKPGLALPPGEWAINPVPRMQIAGAVRSALPQGKGAVVSISVPGGQEAAKKTLNPDLGITGGISILGTTGIVEPMSSEAFKRSLVPQIDLALTAGCRRLVLTPGKMGKRNALRLLAVEPDAVVLASNFIGTMLRACAAKKVEEVVLFGHVGKLMKVAAGIADTHSAVADARREIFVAYGALAGLPQDALLQLTEHNTAEESAAYLIANDYGPVLDNIAAAAALRAEKMAGGSLRVGCVMLNLAGEPLAADRTGKLWLEEKWQCVK